MESTESNFDCIVHLGIAEEAYELICCNKLICSNCVKDLENHGLGCPNCRKPLNVQPAPKMIQNMINNEKKICPDCGYVTTIGEFSFHLPKCSKRPIQCPLEDCHSMVL